MLHAVLVISVSLNKQPSMQSARWYYTENQVIQSGTSSVCLMLDNSKGFFVLGWSFNGGGLAFRFLIGNDIPIVPDIAIGLGSSAGIISRVSKEPEQFLGGFIRRTD